MAKWIVFGAFAGLLVSCGLASAQTATSYELRVYLPEASAPIQSTPITVYTCGQPKLNGSNVNPSRIAWDDPTDGSKDCIAQPSLLIGLPFGNYEATLVAVNTYGSSPESNRAPFVNGGPPSTPTNLRVIK